MISRRLSHPPQCCLLLGEGTLLCEVHSFSLMEKLKRNTYGVRQRTLSKRSRKPRSPQAWRNLLIFFSHWLWYAFVLIPCQTTEVCAACLLHVPLQAHVSEVFQPMKTGTEHIPRKPWSFRSVFCCILLDNSSDTKSTDLLKPHSQRYL